MRNARKTTKRELPPTGLNVTRCTKIIDLGMQKPSNPKFNEAHKIMLEFELVNTSHEFSKDKGPEPFVISKELSVSGFRIAKTSGINNLRYFLEMWRGSGFTDEDLKPYTIREGEINFAPILRKFLGKPALLNIVHKPKATDQNEKKAEIVSIAAPSAEDAKKIKRPYNPIFFFDMGNKECPLMLRTDKEFQKVPWTVLFEEHLYKFLQNKIEVTEDFIEASKKDGFVANQVAQKIEEEVAEEMPEGGDEDPF